MNHKQNKIITYVVSIGLVTLSVLSFYNPSIFWFCKYNVYGFALLYILSLPLVKKLSKNKNHLRQIVNYYGGEYEKLSTVTLVCALSFLPILVVSMLFHDYFLSCAALTATGAILLLDADIEKVVNNNQDLKETVDFSLK